MMRVPLLVGAWVSLVPCANGQNDTVIHAQIPPATPAAVLATLPPPLPNWKVTVSQSSNSYSDWQSTVAQREYVEMPLPPQPGQPPKIPGVTDIYVTDSGYWPSINNTFTDPKWGMGPDQERTTLQNFPAFAVHPKSDDKDGVEQLLIWVKKRFIVQVIVSHQKKEDCEKWANLVNIPMLMQITDDGDKNLKLPLKMTILDELNPANSRSYIMLCAPRKF